MALKLLEKPFEMQSNAEGSRKDDYFKQSGRQKDTAEFYSSWSITAYYLAAESIDIRSKLKGGYAPLSIRKGRALLREMDTEL